MDIDAILNALDRHGVDCLLIGGMNFLLRHQPVLTFDVDIWVRDEPENLGRLNAALLDLGAAWGPTETDWRPVPQDPSWLGRQAVYCLTTRHGALDIFRDVRGLDGRYAECSAKAERRTTATGAPFVSLSTQDMLDAELALPPEERRDQRIRTLRRALGEAR